MKRPSVTATIVCCARGIGVSPEARDEMAPELVGPPVQIALRFFESDSPYVNAARFALRALSFGIVDHNTIRMLVVDAYLRGWVAEGLRQVVILGAGLDSRHWRMPELAGVRLFELDHPASQEIKLSRITSLGLKRNGVHFVPVDLETVSFSESLRQAGYEMAEPAVWICEGVTPYLGPDCIERMLQNAAAMSATGSKFILSYAQPPKGVRSSLLRALIQTFVSKLGEPARGAMTEVDMRNCFEAAGLRPIEDIDWLEWKRRVGLDSRLPNLLKEHIIVAEQKGGI